MKCPTIEEVEFNKENQYILARWYRFCEVLTIDDAFVINLITRYFKGFNSILSKEVGWTE